MSIKVKDCHGMNIYTLTLPFVVLDLVMFVKKEKKF